MGIHTASAQQMIRSWPIYIAVVPMIFVGGFASATVPLCEDYATGFQAPPSRENSVQFDFDRAIPEARKQQIVQIIDSVALLAGRAAFPKKIRFELAEVEDNGIGTAHVLDDKIVFSTASFRLSDRSFVAMTAHEIAHLVVVRGLHGRAAAGSASDSGPLTLLQTLSGESDDSNRYLIHQFYNPYEEFLCDVMAVLVTGDLSAMGAIIDEVRDLAQDDSQLKSIVSKLLLDLPNRLSRRDFKISHKDVGWSTYRPRDMNYNRFNQLRAYIGNRWIKSLPTALLRP